METLSENTGRESMCELKIRTEADILIIHYPRSPRGCLTKDFGQKEMHELKSHIPNLRSVSLKEPIAGKVSHRLHFPSKEELATLIEVPARTSLVAQEHWKEPPP